ncbi:tRNA (adenine-N6)-methyltransferase [Flavobacterium akiainvivens]|uniref:tRNA1(Val) (adenine(37)-N6)-methyltransferase n=1 Tax=Flavobacterium akiainvivens TaxID=1202724 RepID=A0A0M8MCS9_9FLAO|nr:methyltransferase [Flavobacterium akiainvivens]KOS07475.1 tRNA (adenine-N6)-methyltransferase [Flavobacterium akiainvivens]SFQ63361.1 tRNA1Val (adenine37-N6)-methyltransferase [Flavobacterium akiainvivens]
MSDFRFKQFTIHQDKCAMKVGTDGVLLGAWAPVAHNPYNILDIGAGTGLISLMVAQRTYAEQIDSIEIDADAHEQCIENFEASPWGDRLFCYHASLDDFMEEWEEEYDLIASNPPFYTEDYTSGNEQRDQARFAQSLPFEDLAEASGILLSENGVLAVILPYKEEARFRLLAQEEGLYPFKITRVKGTPESEIKRSLLAFSRFETNDIAIDELVIETARHQYTPEYIQLTQDFYLKM